MVGPRGLSGILLVSWLVAVGQWVESVDYFVAAANIGPEWWSARCKGDIGLAGVVLVGYKVTGNKSII